MYAQQVDAIVNVLKDSPDIQDVKQIDEGDNKKVPKFPAITVQLTERSKRKVGMGNIFETTCFFNIWVYVNASSYTKALDELENLTDRVEKVLQSNKTFDNTVKDSSISSNAEFGVTERGGVFIQTARIPMQTTSKLSQV